MAQTARALADAFGVHGGRLYQARAAFPHVMDWCDLSTGILPWAYPISQSMGQAAPLPDPADLLDLEQAAAAAFGADPARVVAVPGTDLAMRLLGTLISGSPAMVTPGYSGHKSMWGSRIVALCRQNELSFAARQHDAVILARPNNPDGWRASRDCLEDAAQDLSARGGYLIVDEAFGEAAPAESLSDCNWPNLIVLRSFGKFFGLAGLRLGFAIAPPEMCRRLRALLGDWPLAGPTIAAGCAAYRDTVWQDAQRTRMMQASLRLGVLLGVHRLNTIGGTSFFTLIETPNRDSLFVHLAQNGVLTRPFRAAPHALRIGLPGSEREWTHLQHALNSWNPK